ncbi:Uncharacterised protein [Bordetella pertussis]|nr:Uncharacterised protein [Bordetella pertussis]
MAQIVFAGFPGCPTCPPDRGVARPLLPATPVSLRPSRAPERTQP